MPKTILAKRDSRTLSATIVPMLISVALVGGGTVAGLAESSAPAYAANPCAAKNPCNPCGAANPCNPCGAGNPCGPCAAGAQAHSEKCSVPRLAAATKANPCAAKNPSKACSPCAPKAACNPCNPCAAKAASCNPCAAKAACNPCNPCAAKAAPCNPCAASNPCNPCNPCGAAAKVDLTAEEAIAAYKCMQPEMLAIYAKSGLATAKTYRNWSGFNVRPYVSDTHGGRYVNNYANKAGEKAYGKFEKAGKLPVASVLAKDSFLVDATGRLSVGPLFLMEKMKAGFNASSGNWRYTLIGPNGKVIGVTGGEGSKNVEFCAECHAGVGDTQDHLFFLPDDVRKP